MITRRSAAALLGGLPFVGRSIATETQAKTISNVGYGVLSGQSAGANTVPMPEPPRMTEWQAARVALNDPRMREELIAAAKARHERVTFIDPDIEVLRSFSPMAKITFQRQRNVEREIAAMLEPPPWELMNKAQSFIRNIMFGRS